jgi:hypothetical protein
MSKGSARKKLELDFEALEEEEFDGETVDLGQLEALEGGPSDDKTVTPEALAKDVLPRGTS